MYENELVIQMLNLQEAFYNKELTRKLEGMQSYKQS